MHKTMISPVDAVDWRSAIRWATLAALIAMFGSSLGTSAAAGTLTFDDEFTDFVSSPDGSSGWMTSFPGQNRSLWSNHDGEWYSDSSVGVNPFALKGGVLSITAEPAGPGDAPDGLQYTSGIITTYTSFSQTYGLFEIRAKLPAGQGLWPAFWLLPASNQYTAELDALEVLGQAPSVAYFTAIGANRAGVWNSNPQQMQTVDTSAAFHTYAVDWAPREIAFYVDGRKLATSPTPASMNTPMYMLINLAVGGEWSWPGPPDSTTPMPATMQIKWVRAYATKYTRSVSGSRAIVPQVGK